MKKNPWASVIDWHQKNASIIRVEGSDKHCREKLGIFEGAQNYQFLQVQPLKEGEEQEQKNQEDAYYER